MQIVSERLVAWRLKKFFLNLTYDYEGAHLHRSVVRRNKGTCILPGNLFCLVMYLQCQTVSDDVIKAEVISHIAVWLSPWLWPLAGKNSPSCWPKNNHRIWHTHIICMYWYCWANHVLWNCPEPLNVLYPTTSTGYYLRRIRTCFFLQIFSIASISSPNELLQRENCWMCMQRGHSFDCPQLLQK